MNRDVYFSSKSTVAFLSHDEISGAKRQLVDKLQKSKNTLSASNVFPSIFTLPTIFSRSSRDDGKEAFNTTIAETVDVKALN